MSLELCTHSGCGRETNRSVSKDGKCIFHCEKRSWFLEMEGKQDWNKSKDKVKAFWIAFREEWVDKKTSDFSYFIFPEFTTDADFIRSPELRQLNEEEAKQRLDFRESHFLGRVAFSYATFAQGADFRHVSFKHNADFRRATFAQRAIFDYASFEHNADFNSASFEQSANFTGAIFTQIADFKLAIFKSGVYFWESTFTQNANFNDATFHDSVEFRDVKFSGNSTFEATQFEGMWAWFEKCVFDGSASFLDLAAAPSLIFHSATVNGHFRIGANIVAKMKQLTFFQCTFKKDSVVIIDNLIVDILSTKHLVCLSPAIKLGSLQVTQELTIHDSTLSGAEMNNINLEKVPVINIAYSSLSKTIFNNVQWGDVGRIKADRDTFRQLKAANEDQKNYLQANEFYMMEMKQYREEIKKREWWRQERIDFWFGDFVSRFSNNWVRPIWLFLIVSFGFHFVAFTCLHWEEINDFRRSFLGHLLMPVEAWGFYLLNLPINDFAHFINPLAREAGERYESVYGWWLLHKIIGGLIIYQIIVSLRRKTRR